MPVPEISVDAVHALAAGGPGADAPLLLDVRQPEEFRGPLGHVPGATLLPLGELFARLHELEPWRDRPVVVICRSGHRSAHATGLLLAEGFQDVRNMTGGTLAWRERGFPVER